ncbi:uncharacterized protein EV420DRAFT_1535313 [Desarmillaria tabescens]|uniref:F-box domain-containing protein n=1 Tax=Armillaria tabescens TaxID=1929756 RepID=A0AA39KG35_ARMTA|nr:uncharacterized protein EV420DRAFT_1535313 [Desarmillaria tabescens]KAK0460148.1 hypothetical protein EV420DRAFT_1535313 [Desarmillaria tabescens]
MPDPSSTLPLELVQKIFGHYLKDRKYPVQSFDFSDGLWVLGQVSSAWRSASLSSKSLWSTIEITIKHPSSKKPGIIADDIMVLMNLAPLSDACPNPEVRAVSSHAANQVLAEILHRSGDLPLDIFLSFPIPSAVNPTSPTWSRLFTLLLVESSRWRSFVLAAPDVIWESFSEVSPSHCPLLRDIDAFCEGGFSSIPILRTCTNVKKLSIHSLKRSSSISESTVIHMPFLQDLEVGGVDMLNVITAPNISTLRLTGSAYPQALPNTSVPDFLHRSRCSLVALDLTFCTNIDLIDILSNIQSLHSFSVSVFFGEELSGLLVKMKSDSSFLPKLQELNLSIDQFRTGVESNCYAELILDVVESRIAGGALKSVTVEPMNVEMKKISKSRLDALNALPNVNIKLMDGLI